jgi:hypothetical protein
MTQLSNVGDSKVYVAVTDGPYVSTLIPVSPVWCGVVCGVVCRVCGDTTLFFQYDLLNCKHFQCTT